MDASKPRINEREFELVKYELTKHMSARALEDGRIYEFFELAKMLSRDYSGFTKLLQQFVRKSGRFLPTLPSGRPKNLDDWCGP